MWTLKAMANEHKFINVFRALAAFWVLTAHTMFWGGWQGISLPNPKMAVDIFMLISGYLMTANLTEKHVNEPLTTSRNQLRFWLRRFFRLAPAYYFSLFIAVIGSSYYLVGYETLAHLKAIPLGSVYDPTRINYSWENILLHLSFLFGLHPTWSFSSYLPDWSLSLEMQFYVAFPFLMIFLPKRNIVYASLMLGIVTFVIGFFVNKSFAWYEPSLLLFKLNYFLAGMLSFYIVNADKKSVKTIGLIVSAFILVSLEIKYKLRLIIMPCLLFCFLYVGRLEQSNRAPGWMRMILNSKFVHFASNTSYGVYLFHGFYISACGLILASFEKAMSLTLSDRVFFMLIFVTVLSYLTSYWVFRIVELPGIKFGRLFIGRFIPLHTQSHLAVLKKTSQADAI